MGLAAPQAEVAHQFHHVVERESQGYGLGPGRQVRHREKGTAEKEHGRDEQEDGKIEQTIVLTNASNIDWEDIAQDDTHIYIGDIGNNPGNREDLVIYKVNKSNITKKSKVKLKAEKIHFSFADQKDTNTERDGHDFDCEAMVVCNHKIILFSKNWKNNKTRMYHVPLDAGEYEVKSVASFRANGLITGADYNPATSGLILTGVAIGAGLGVWASTLFIPYFQVGNDKTALVPPFVVQVAWEQLGIILIIFGTMFVVAVAVLAVLLTRMRVFEAVKLGETV